MFDTQITELASKQFLISQLIAGGVEVAHPLRDRGIDLLAYLDRQPEAGKIFVCPIQLKANEDARFGLHQKYEIIPSLLMVYAWKVSSSQPELDALTYAEAENLLSDRGHTDTNSWNKLGGYSLSVNETWRKLLRPHRMLPADWKEKIVKVCNGGGST